MIDKSLPPKEMTSDHGQSIHELFESGLSAKGTPYLCDWDVIELLGYCAAKNIIVQSMEATRLDDDGDLPLVEHSMLGLEEASVWGACNDIRKISDLVKSKLASGRMEINPMRYQLWLRE